jgi:eukaryotic-like serine/threonine-protein kinase
LALLDGLVAGSPHYLAPEQLQGGAVDARTDIHALGVVFYELLAGRKAYTGDSVEQIGMAVLTNHPAPAHEFRSGVPPLLSAIAARAMAREPSQRFSSAAAMAVELRRWGDKNQAFESAAPAEATAQALAPRLELPPVRPPGGTPRQGRRRAPWTALLGCTVVAVLAGSVWAWQGSLIGAPVHMTPWTAPTPTPAAQVPAAAAAPAVPPVALLTDARSAAAAAALASGRLEAAVAASVSEPVAVSVPERLSVAVQVPLPRPALTPATASASPSTATPASPSTLSGPSSGSPAAGKNTPAPPLSKAKAPSSPAAKTRDSRTAPSAATAMAAATASPVITGTLQLAISPWGLVEVNGVAAGTTPPLTRLTLPEGTHTVTVRNEDFPPMTFSVLVSADKPVTVRHRFSP